MGVVAQRAQGTPEDEMTLAEIVEEMKRIRAVMALDQQRFDRLKAESRTIKAELQILKAETRSAMNQIQALVTPEEELALAEIAEEMTRLRAQMDRDQAEIERSRSSSREYGRQTQQMLDELKSMVFDREARSDRPVPPATAS